MSVICERCKMLTEPMGYHCEFCGKIVSKKIEKELKKIKSNK